MIVLRPWTDADHPVAVRSNAPELMTYLGGPESSEKVAERAARYANGWRTGANSMFVVTTDDPTVNGGVPGNPGAVGIIGYWPLHEPNADALETGWTIFVPGRGYATEALRLMLAHAEAHSDRRTLHAYPRTDHDASNALCRRAGFELVGAIDMEYPPGTPIRSNDWRCDLDSLRPSPN